MNYKSVIGITALLLGTVFTQPNDYISSVDESEMEDEEQLTYYLETLNNLCSGDDDIEIEDIKNERARNELIENMCKKGTAGQASNSCPTNFISIDDECYHLSVSGADWNVARLICRSMGADLVTFCDYDEYDDIQKSLRYYFDLQANWWTGAFEQERNSWTWTVAAQHVPTGIWCPGEPPVRNNTDETTECMMMTTTGCGESLPCTNSQFNNKMMHFVCEINADCERELSES